VKLSPKTINAVIFALGALAAALGGMQTVIEQNPSAAWVALAVGAVTGLAGYFTPRAQDLTPRKAEARVQAAVERRLESLRVMPDEPRDYE
jgi:hypothetical protein